MFLLDQDPDEGSVEQQRKRFGHNSPNRFKEAPELVPGLELYLEAFFELSSERSEFESYGRIKTSSVVQYAKAFGFDEVQTEDLIFFTKRMDAAYLEKQRLKKSG